jgi:hypothetical protein
VVETPSCSQSLVLSQVNDLDLWKFFRGIFDEVAENSLVVVSNHAYFLNGGDFRDGDETMPDDGMASDFKEGLQTMLDPVLLSFMQGAITFGRSRDNGLNLVPLDGPPTC